MRIVSLLPSATEILFALSLDDQIVGVSHECDYPALARTKRVVIRSRLPHDAAPAEIDRMVREYVSRGESLYSVDGEALEESAPDLIVTQDLCHVCAATPGDLLVALARLPRRPQVLSLNPHGLSDVWADIAKVGEATGRAEQASRLISELEQRIAQVEAKVCGLRHRPRVAFLEWLDPLYVSGHWVPEMIARAGGQDIFGRAGTPSFRVTPEQVIAAAPEILLIAPCGYDAKRARDEYLRTSFPEEWNQMPAIREARVYALEANAYFSRPGPRLVTGIEALAKLFHPAAEVSPEAERASVSINSEVRAARAAPR